MISAIIARQDGQDNKPYIFRTYDNVGGQGLNPHNPGRAHECEIWEAGRATSAAPPYLDPMVIGEHEYFDGGIGCNDPTSQLYRDILIHAEWHPGSSIPIPVSIVLTLGTGGKPTQKEKVKGLLARSKPIRRISKIFSNVKATVVGTGHVEQQMVDDSFIHKFKYFKWTGGEEVGGLPLDKSKLKIFTQMEGWVKEYMQGDDCQVQVREVARHLVAKRRERYSFDQDRWQRFAFCTLISCPLSHCEEGPFRTKARAKEHAALHHPNTFTNLDSEVETPLKETLPWMRGPW